MRPFVQVCEATSSCAFTASCTVSIDNCYQAFKDSLTITSLGDSFAICPSSCSFQPMPAAGAGDALFRPLPTMVTTAAGNTSVSNGICYNRTLWDACTSKTTEVRQLLCVHACMCATPCMQQQHSVRATNC